MAIIQRKRKSGIVHQVKVRGSRGECISKTFKKKRDALTYEASLKVEKANKGVRNSCIKKLSFKDYFETWHEKTKNIKTSEGWRSSQLQMYRDYINPIIGDFRLEDITTSDIIDVLNGVHKQGRSKQTKLHVYNLLHKNFNDAAELFDIQIINPVKKSLKPDIPEKESPYLEKGELIKLLSYVKYKPFGLAIWIESCAGLRAGEVQALKWRDVDFVNNKIMVKSTYVRKEKRFKDSPKGKKWHGVSIPLELVTLLQITKKNKTDDDYVVTPDNSNTDFLSYSGYYKAVKRYCKELGIRIITTHGLRHSTHTLYPEASCLQLQEELFAHSSSEVTKRYIHNRPTGMSEIVKNLIMFPSNITSECSPNVPQTEIAQVDKVNQIA